jgi:hypothetical protein
MSRNLCGWHRGHLTQAHYCQASVSTSLCTVKYSGMWGTQRDLAEPAWTSRQVRGVSLACVVDRKSVDL